LIQVRVNFKNQRLVFEFAFSVVIDGATPAHLRCLNMAHYDIPPNTGKVKIAMGVAGTFAVWNGKQGKNEFKILVRTRKQAEELMKIINEKRHNGSLEVMG